jgi:hypothetical protein
MSIKEIADNSQRDYGFMALNAVGRSAQMLLKIHDMQGVEELRLVYNELMSRGVKEIKNQQEYDAAVAKHGTPPLLRKSA